MTPPRASNQVSLWRRGEWVCGYPAPPFVGWRNYAAAAISVTDKAILKMMGKDDEQARID